ncbi:MAG TPA: helix-turn-helix domain-containing protein, partial [Streptomyces sp.]|uniref:helix-turn-helix domain-containing protein n=1 Tax=Streptomyces sp. TaxID=1931 RepID=UPI002C150ABE
MGDRAGHTPITPLQQAFRLMEAVGAHDGGVPADRLARETELPVEAVRELLWTLTQDGYLRRLDDGGYVLGAKLHGGHCAQDLVSRVRPALASLRDDLSAAAYLTFYE